MTSPESSLRSQVVRSVAVVLGWCLFASPALADGTAMVTSKETAKDLSDVMARPIGAREHALSRFSIERQVRIILWNRMSTRETVLGDSLLEKHSAGCVRAATLEVMAAEPTGSASKLYALDLMLQTTRKGGKLSRAETCALDAQLPTLPTNNAVAPMLLDELSGVRFAGTSSRNCSSVKLPSQKRECSRAHRPPR